MGRGWWCEGCFLFTFFVISQWVPVMVSFSGENSHCVTIEVFHLDTPVPLRNLAFHKHREFLLLSSCLEVRASWDLQKMVSPCHWAMLRTAIKKNRFLWTPSGFSLLSDFPVLFSLYGAWGPTTLSYAHGFQQETMLHSQEVTGCPHCAMPLD